MALDRQRILGELGSVMKQLQNADCGCLGKLFGNSQQAAPSMMGSPLPTCGGCRRACCHGHGYVQPQYNSPTNMNQPPPNMNYMPMDGSNPSQPIPGSMFGFGPQIVNMMKGDHTRSQNMTGQPQGPLQGQMSGPLTGPMVIDAPQSPHGKVGITPFTPRSMVQGQFQPDNMNQGDVAGQMQNQFTPNLSQSNANGNIANMSPWSQNISSNSAVPQSATPQMNPWPQQNMSSNPATHQTSPPHNPHPHGQHAEGIAKFNKMFPGVKQGMGGNLGFDPMAIAIQMNPDNHLQSAMDTMHKIMNGNKGTDQILNKPLAQQQPGVAGNIMNQSPLAVNGTMQQNVVPDQVIQSNNNQIVNPQATGHNVIPNQGSQNQQYTYANAYGQPIPQQNQQVYAAAVNPNAVNQSVRYDDTQQLVDHQHYDQQQMMNLNSSASNLPVIQQEETTEENQLEAPPPEDNGYPAQTLVQQIIKEPIFPVDTSKNLMYMPTKRQKNNNYGYNTLGQPVEILPAKIYHPPEPSLPQTLSPQPDPVKTRNGPPPGVNVKATISKTSLMGYKPVGKTPSRAQLQHIYNQYKGSQSFTQQNVRHPGEGTCSAGKLNVPQTTKAPTVPVERVGGDTVVNNPPSNQNRINKVEHIMEQIGDVPVAKPAGDSLPVKEAPAPTRKCRNGLQDMVYTSYPTSTAWSFHGHGRNDYSPTRRFPHRRY